ncbi:prolyl oligopeptidase family serine peptidase [Candidatus Poribacteria bacterium]|nr:prolyl oligopeptidase family serine peptidase [Candidatus Poribacteria bacterium]
MENERPVFRLWSGDAPEALGQEDKDIPTLTLYTPEPEKATGACIVICPGGGYHGLAPHEGWQYALWLNQQGITGFVLKYRLASSGYKHPTMFYDIERAMKYTRFKAPELGLDVNRIGVVGSSAGGHLSSLILTHFDTGKKDAEDPIEGQSSRPDIGILCYPVISMDPEIGHAGCRQSLIGDSTTEKLVRWVSTELQVKPDTPPCFLWHTYEDGGVKVENSMVFAKALSKNRIPFELHIYEKGAHGLGLGSREYDPENWHPWTTECSRWLKERDFGRG